MSKQKFDKFWIGFVLGIIGAFIGLCIFGLIWSNVNDQDFAYFFKDVFIGTRYYTDKLITMSVVLDVFLFFIFMKMEWYNLSKGLLGVVILAVPIVVYFY